MNDLDYIYTYLPKLPPENITNILLEHKNKLDEHKCRMEKTGAGTYLYIDRIPPELAFYMRRSIEYIILK